MRFAHDVEIGISITEALQMLFVDGFLLARASGKYSDRIACAHMSGLLLWSHVTTAKMVSAT